MRLTMWRAASAFANDAVRVATFAGSINPETGRSEKTYTLSAPVACNIQQQPTDMYSHLSEGGEVRANAYRFYFCSRPTSDVHFVVWDGDWYRVVDIEDRKLDGKFRVTGSYSKEVTDEYTIS